MDAIENATPFEYGGAADPALVVDPAIDRWVAYAGWADKVAQVLGGSNPVAGRHPIGV